MTDDFELCPAWFRERQLACEARYPKKSSCKRPLSVFEIQAQVERQRIGASDHVVTLADHIHQLVCERGSIKINDLASVLRQPKGEVERLCYIMEERGVFDLDYNLFSSATVSVKKNQKRKGL